METEDTISASFTFRTDIKEKSIDISTNFEQPSIRYKFYCG